MKKNILFRTNILVCIVIILGFVITSVISYQSNQGIFRKDIEHVSNLTSEGIYYQIDSNFTKPINVSLTMANDSLLKEFLEEETAHLEDEAFISSMRTYLNAYREKYRYDSVFLVSTKTGRYYHFNGLDRTLTEDNPENVWYYEFLKTGEEYSLNIDNDEAAQNEITVFINCKIKDPDGIMGVVGVGFRVDSLQDLLKDYEEEFGVKTFLIDRTGAVEISTEQTGYQRTNLFESCDFPELKEKILASTNESETYWYGSDQKAGYVVSQYVPTLNWHLIVEKDASALNHQLNLQLMRGILVILIIVALVLLTITSVIRKYNAQIIQLTVAKEQEHSSIFQKATKQLYEDIYELDVTHNRAASEATEDYFESLGVPKNTPYDQALHIIAEKQIKAEYRQGYMDMFAPESVQKAYENGTETLQYDFMITNDGENYYWMRITARLFYWKDDNSLRMLVYRQNIDSEKQYQSYLFDQMQKDSLTGLYNKAATQERIREELKKRPSPGSAFFITDIDDFKQVNDRMGHAAGDAVLAEFAQTLKSQFREGDIVGRIGGDEFVAFLPVADRAAAEKKACELVAALCREVVTEAGSCRISSSIGIALTPEAGTDFETLYRNADFALYRTKKTGKNSFAIYEDKE